MTVYISKRQTDGVNRWFNVTSDRKWELDDPSRVLRERTKRGDRGERFIRLSERKKNSVLAGRISLQRSAVDPRSDPETQASVASGEGLSDAQGARREAAKDAQTGTVGRVTRGVMIPV